MALLLSFGLNCQSGPLFAQNNASPRGAQHDGFGRLVFDWDGGVKYSADIVNDDLVIRFDRPASGDFHRVIRPLARYLRDVSVSGDRKTATFSLLRPVQLKTATSDNGSVVIDLYDQPKGDAAPPRQSSPPQAAASTEAETQDRPREQPAEQKYGGPTSLLPTTTAPPAVTAPALPGKPEQSSLERNAPKGAPSGLEIRAGERGGYNRMIFSWPSAVAYRVVKEGDHATLTFLREARVDLPALRAQLPSDIQAVSADSGKDTTKVSLNLPKGARIRHFLSGSKVVVDIVRDASTPAPPGAPVLPADADVTADMPSLKPLTPEEAPSLPSDSLNTATTAPPAKEVPAKEAPAKEVPAKAAPGAVKPSDAEKTPEQKTPPPPPAVAGSSTTAAAPSPEEEGETYSLSVPWEKPVAAAVFRRGGYLYAVFDRHEEVDTNLLRRMGGAAVTFAEQLKNRDATILRFIVQPDFHPSVRRDGLLWVIDLSHRDSEPKQPIGITAPAALSTGVGIALSVADAGTVVPFSDPEIGDAMIVVPVQPLGAGIYPGRETPDMVLLPSVQGVAIVPRLDGLDVRSSRTGITIGSPVNGGLLLSSEPDRKAGQEGPVTAFFDIPTWMRGGADRFAEERRAVDQDLAAVPPIRRAAAELSAARFYFANGFAAEALGNLRLAAMDEPTLVDTGPFRALRGAANAHMLRWNEAIADLDNPLVKDDAEADFWRAVAHSGKAEDLAPLDKDLAKGLAYIKTYPKALQWPLALTIANSAIAADDEDAAAGALDLIDRMAVSSAEKGRREYLRGTFDEIRGKFDKALERYAKAEASDDREARARATLAEVELRLKTNTIDIKKAEERLDRLRFAWRDETFEFYLLKRLALLQEQSGDYAEALRSLRSLANYYPNNKGAPEVARKMQDIFAKLYLNGAADSMPPVSAIALYDEFRDLTPMGAKGDEMIRKLADRLVSVDLLDRAAELLKHQVAYRLEGADKLRVGTQLAVLDLLDQKPKDALDALAASEIPNIPADLMAQRRHLKANALAYAGRVPEAIALLVGDASPEAALLRAEIYWRKQDWPNAALAFAALVPPPQGDAKLDDASAKLVLSWATALILGNDEHGLAALRRNFADSLDNTPYRDGFVLLTSSLDRGTTDMPGVMEKIKQAEGFRTFLADYKSRVQKEGLSGMN